MEEATLQHLRPARPRLWSRDLGHHQGVLREIEEGAEENGEKNGGNHPERSEDQRMAARSDKSERRRGGGNQEEVEMGEKGAEEADHLLGQKNNRVEAARTEATEGPTGD